MYIHDEGVFPTVAGDVRRIVVLVYVVRTCWKFVHFTVKNSEFVLDKSIVDEMTSVSYILL